MKKETITLLCVLASHCFLLGANIITPFWQETFNASLPSAWTVGDASGQGILWTHCDAPNDCPPFTQSFLACENPIFRSNSFDDGYMFVNAYAAGTILTPSQSYLRTPMFDCSDKSAVFIEFKTYIYAESTDPDLNAVLRVKSGNGAWTTFTVFPNLNKDTYKSLKSWNAQPVLIDISSVAANQSNVIIEWLWTSKNDVSWMIDDIALYDSNPIYENVIWGQNATQGDFAGGPNGWTVTNQLDSCKWVWVNNGTIHLPVGSKADALACWTGASNGAMLMNASYCNLAGNPSIFSRSDLKSPTINLSAIAPGTRLVLKFDQVARLANRAVENLPQTSIGVSIDNGFSFIEIINANVTLPYLNGTCGEARFYLPEAVAGSEQVRLVFIFSGDSHYWLVDNIRIATADDFDLEVNNSFYNVAPDFETPSSQLRPIKLFTQIRNSGNLTSTDVVAFCEVKNEENTVVFTDSVFVGNLEPGSDWLDIGFPEKFLPDAQPHSYTVWYGVKAGQADEFEVNNKVYWRYSVTDGIFSKNEFCHARSGYFYSSELQYEIGNCYYIPKGANLKAKTVSFAFANSARLNAGGAQLSIGLYEWRKGANAGDVNNDTIANFNEYELIAFNAYNVQGDENGSVITVPLSAEEDSVDLKNDTYYFVTIGYPSPVIYNGVVQPFPIAGSEEIDFAAMFYNSFEDGIPSYTTMLREKNEVDFRANAWALRRIPFVNLNVVPFFSKTDEKLADLAPIIVSPNPATDFVTLTAEFLDKQALAEIEIFDICGHLVFHQAISGGNVSQLPIDIRNLSNGLYSLRVIAGEKMASTKLMVLHE